MNSFGDFFRFIFGDTRGPSYNEPFTRDHSYGDNGVDSVFHHFHSDMQQHMEEIQQQMDDMMKNFGTVEFSNMPRIEFPTPDGSSPSNHNAGNLRDNMLRSPDALPLESKIPSQLPSINTPSRGQQDRSFFGGFGFPRLNPFSAPTDEPKRDRDLDGRELDFLKDLESSQCVECPVPKDMPSNFFFRGQSVTVRSVQGSDGKMEQRRKLQNSSGRKEETCTRYVDGKMHSVTHKVDEEGNEEKIEEFKNMDESDLSSFNKSWNTSETHDATPPEYPADRGMPQPSQDSYLGSIFSKLFGFKP